MIAHLARSFLALALFIGVVSAASSSLDTVEITATVVTAQEGGTPGRFRLHRSGSSGILVVNLVLDGVDAAGLATAPKAASYSGVGGPTGIAISSTSNMDYGLDLDPSTKLNGATSTLPILSAGGFSVTFAPGQQDIDILVNAYEDGVKEGQENVKVRFLQNPSYIIGVGSVATVTIADNDILATLGMPDQTLSEFYGDPSPEGNFEILFNDISFSRYLVFTLEGAAARATDYTPQGMFMHQPSAGEVASVTLRKRAEVSYSFTPVGASPPALTGTLSGSGWYVNYPPNIAFQTISDASRVSLINQLIITSSNALFPAGTVIPLNAVGGSSLTNGRPARGYGIIDSSGQLVSVKLIDAGVFAKSDITGANAIIDITYGTGVAKATIDASAPSGSDAKGVAVLNGIVTAVSVTAGGSGYSQATVSFVNAVGDTTGTGATGSVQLNGVQVQRVIITNPGHGYTKAPTLAFSGDGTGASATATIEGPVVRVDVTNAGVGYLTMPAFTATSSNPSDASVAASLADAIQADFDSIFNSRVHNPDFFGRRSSGPDDRVRIPWTAKVDSADSNATNYNKKGTAILSAIEGGGPLTIGDVITIGGTSQLYTIIGKALPVNGNIYYRFSVSPALQTDVSDDTVITNAPTIAGDIQSYSIPSFGTVGYYAMHVGITPVDDALAEGAESVTLRVLANNDYAIQNPTVQTMQIADDNVIADITWINNGSEPNLSGQARVTITTALDKDITIPILIGGSATPGAGLTTDPIQTFTGNTKQDEANKSDYVITGITDIVPPKVDATGALVTQASARGSVTIPKGQKYVDIIVGVQDDAFSEGSEYVTITIQRTDDVVLAGSPGTGINPSATINISDNLGMVSVGYSVEGKENPTAPTSGVIRFIVDGNKGVVPTNVSVGFTVGGSATYNSDFIFGGSAFTVDPSAGKGYATIQSQEPIWITSVSGAAITAVSANGLASVANGSVVVIGSASYVVNSGGGTISSGSGTNLVLDRAVEEPVAGTILTTSSDTPLGSLSLQVSAGQAVNLAPKSGLVINGQIYIFGGFNAKALLPSGSTLDVSQALREAIPKNTPIYLALRPATELLIQVKDDLIAEGTEAVLVNLVAGSGYTISSIASSSSVAILDDEPILSAVTQKAAFEPRTDGSFIISYPGTALNRSITVNLGVTTPSSGKNAAGVPIQSDSSNLTGFSVDSSGNRHYYASPGLDYQPLPQSVIIPAGSNTVEVPVVIIADVEVEPTEEVEIYLTAPADKSYAIDSGVAVVSIYDAPTLSVKALQDAAEGGQSGKFRFSRTDMGGANEYKGTIHVSAEILSSSTAVPDVVGAFPSINDFPVVSNSFLSQPSGVGKTVYVDADIPEGLASVDVTIPVSEDNVADRGEVISIGIRASKDYKIDTEAKSATIAIVDNEPAVELTAIQNANEGGVSGQIKISLAAPIPSGHGAFLVPVVLSGDALYGTDYTISGQTVDDTTQTLLVTIPENFTSVILNFVPRAANGVTDPIRQVVATVRLGRSDLGSGYSSKDATRTASINILDDLPVISLIRLATTGDTDLSEPDIAGAFRISASVVPASNLIVKFTLGGSAILGTDYSMTNATQAVINAGTSFVDVPVTPIDDFSIEGIEGIDVSLSPNGTLYAIDSTKGSLTLLIGDDEFTGGLPVVSVTADDTTAYEEKRVPGAFTLTRSYGVGPMIVSFALTGTATAADYEVAGTGVNLSTGTVTFASGAKEAKITIAPVDDATVEGIESVIFTIVPKKIYDISERSSASLNIADNDIATTLTIVDPIAIEANLKSALFRINSVPASIDRNFKFTVGGTAKLGTSGSVAADYYLSYRFQGSSAFSLFTPSASPVPADFRVLGTIPAGSDYIEFQLTPTSANFVDDTEFEGRETAIFTLEENEQYSLGSPRAGLITISDNDAQVSITAKDGGEPLTSGEFTIKLSGPLPVDVDIPYTVGGTATPGADYEPLRPVKIKAGDTLATIAVDVKKDNWEEPTETVKVTLSSSLDYAISGGSSATVNIADLYATVSVNVLGVSAAEPTTPSGFVITANRKLRNDGTQPGFSVNYTLEDSSATIGVDFITPDSLAGIAIPSGVSSVQLIITPLDDAIFEGDETVVLTLKDGPGYEVNPVANTASLTILDDEPTISLTKIQDGAEPNIPAVFMVSYPGYPAGTALGRKIQVVYKLVGSSTAATPGKDFVLPSDLTVEINAGSLFGTFQLSILDDLEVDPGETITLALAGGNSYAINGAAQTATALIIDDEPTVSVVASPPAAEGGANGFFTIGYTGAAITRPVNVTFALSGTATAASGSSAGDYSISTGYVGVTIPAGSTSVTVPVSVVDDLLIEGDETIKLTLLASAFGGYKLGEKASDTLIIVDNDLPTISIKGQSEIVSKPSGHGKITLKVSPIVSSPTRVKLGIKTIFGTTAAVPGRDYVALDLTKTFDIPANKDNLEIIIDALPDNTPFEPNSAVILEVLPGEKAYSIDPADNNGTVFIKDGPPIYARIGGASDATEGGAVGQVAVSLSEAVNADVKIALTVGGTASPIADYTALPNEVLIPKGQAEVVLSIMPVADGIIEQDETVVLSLGSGPLYTLLTNTATVNIHSASTDVPPVGSLVASDTGKNGGCGTGGGVALIGLGGLLYLRRRRKGG